MKASTFAKNRVKRLPFNFRKLFRIARNILAIYTLKYNHRGCQLQICTWWIESEEIEYEHAYPMHQRKWYNIGRLSDVDRRKSFHLYLCNCFHLISQCTRRLRSQLEHYGSPIQVSVLIGVIIKCRNRIYIYIYVCQDLTRLPNQS